MRFLSFIVIIIFFKIITTTFNSVSRSRIILFENVDVYLYFATKRFYFKRYEQLEFSGEEWHPAIIY